MSFSLSLYISLYRNVPKPQRDTTYAEPEIWRCDLAVNVTGYLCQCVLNFVALATSIYLTISVGVISSLKDGPLNPHEEEDDQNDYDDADLSIKQRGEEFVRSLDAPDSFLLPLLLLLSVLFFSIHLDLVTSF